MQVPMFIAKKVLGRSGYSKSRMQTDGYGYDVPYIKQKHANMCGEACVEMLSQYYGWGFNINMGSNPRGMAEGLDGADMLGAYGTKLTVGYAQGAYFIEDLLKRRGPIICSGEFAHMGILGDSGHWIVVKGADGGNFWTHDPWHGANVKVAKTTFENALHRSTRDDPTILYAL